MKQLLLDHIEPEQSWVRQMRKALGMSLRQLGKRMHIAPQSVMEIERREVAGTVSLNVLREAAEAMGMRLVYTIRPESGTVRDILTQRARQLAREIVVRAREDSSSPAGAGEEELVEELAQKILEQMPRYFWDA